MLATVVRILVLLALVWGVVVLLAWIFQNRLAFPGPNSPEAIPASVGLDDGELVTVRADDGVTLRGWYLPPPATVAVPAPAVIWFYGNMETVYDLAASVRWLRPPAAALLVLDYRGYGMSDGSATESGLYRDAEAAWSFLTTRPEIDTTRVGVYGRSLGSAVGLYLATERPVRALVLDSPFTTGRAMAGEHYPFVPGAFLTLELDNLGRARRLAIPLLIFHGTKDIISPVAMGEAIAEAGNAEEFIRLEGAGHNDTYIVGADAYRDRLHAFWQDHLGVGSR